MSVHRYRGAWRSADAVGLEQVGGRDHGRHGPDFGHRPSPVFRGAESTQHLGAGLIDPGQVGRIAGEIDVERPAISAEVS